MRRTTVSSTTSKACPKSNLRGRRASGIVYGSIHTAITQYTQGRYENGGLDILPTSDYNMTRKISIVIWSLSHSKQSEDIYGNHSPFCPSGIESQRAAWPAT